MKKILALFCSALLLLSAAGCQKKSFLPTNTSPEYVFATDVQTYFANDGGKYQLTASEDGYYYINLNGFLHFIDKETLQDIPLCNKPDCIIHENEDAYYSNGAEKEPCNAYVESVLDPPIFYYEGALYLLTMKSEIQGNTVDRRYFLTRISLDGTERRDLWEVTWEEEIKFPHLSSYLFHRGMLYFVVKEQESDSRLHPSFLYAYSMATGDCKLLHQGKLISTLTAYGDQLFFQESSEKALEEASEYMATPFYSYTISTGEVKDYPGVNMFVYSSQGLLLLYPKNEQDGIIKLADYHAENEKVLGEVYNRRILGGNSKWICTTGGIRFERVSDGKELTWEECLTMDSKEYRILHPQTFDILEISSLEPIASIPAPFFRTHNTVVHLNEEQIFAFDARESILYVADLADVGSETFEWKSSAP